ncbi:hypothetical protein [Sorangium sp. So ce131]|uniref:hypothetical protein n=1 Tax=Sorangium sp. So ce131 TaxID=3133282 RepID=UPI003F62C4A1
MTARAARSRTTSAAQRRAPVVHPPSGGAMTARMELDDGEVRLTENVTIRLSKEERAGLKWLAKQRAIALRAQGIEARATEGTAFRELLNRELRAKGWDPERHMPPEPPANAPKGAAKRGS